MNLTLSPGDKLEIVLAGSSVTFASIQSDLQSGRIKHGEPHEGKAISVYHEEGTVTITATIKGDYDGDGTITIDDTAIDNGPRVVSGLDFAHRIE